jgi:hypothetical protein
MPFAGSGLWAVPAQIVPAEAAQNGGVSLTFAYPLPTIGRFAGSVEVMAFFSLFLAERTIPDQIGRKT